MSVEPTGAPPVTAITPSTADLIAADDAARQSATFSDVRLIDAPAGSGKTETIVARILREVLISSNDGQPLPVDRVVAATFTIAAAAELRGRVRTRLEQLRMLLDARDNGEPTDTLAGRKFVAPLADALTAHSVSTDEAIERIAQALDHLDDAPWGTLHSVCNWIIHRSAPHLATPAALGFLDEVSHTSLVAAAAEETRLAAEAWLSEHEAGHAMLSTVTQRQVEALTAALHEQHLGQGTALLAAGSAHAGPADHTVLGLLLASLDARFAAAAQAVVAALDTHGAEHLATSDGTSLSDALAASLSPEGAGWPVARKDALGYLAAVLVAGSADDSPDRRRTRTLLLLHGKANNMTHPSDCPALAEGGVLQRVSAQTKATKWINAVKNAVAPAWEASDPLGAAPGLVDKPAFVLEKVARELATAALLESAMTAAEGTVETRRSHGLVTFDDLIDLTLEAITAGVVAMDEHAPRLLVIDELQDSDPLQHRLLAAMEAAGVPVVAVGDVRQSIYRFRGARPHLFQDRADREARERKVCLTRTFRHPTGLARAFNELFAVPIATAGVTSPEAISWEAAELGSTDSGPADPNAATPEAATPLSIAVFEADAKAQDSRRSEAQAVVGELLQLRATDPPTLWSDIAILVPTRASLSAIRHAMARHGIPAMVVAASGLSSSAEVRSLDAALRWVVTGQRVDQAGAWTSPWFARPISDLIPTRPWRPADADGAKAGAGAAPGVRPPPPPDLLDAWRALEDSRARLAGSPAGDAALEIMTILGIPTRLRMLAERDADLADHMAACARYVLGEAMVAQEAGASLTEHVRDTTTDPAEELLAARRGSRTGDERDAVRINTIHGAKGLEYEHVVLAGVSSPPKPEHLILAWPGDAPDRWFGGQLSKDLAVRTHPAGDPKDAKDQDKGEAAAEADRLLYVALTRARQTATAVVGADPPEEPAAVAPVDAQTAGGGPDSPSPDTTPDTGAGADLVTSWWANPASDKTPVHHALHARTTGLAGTVDAAGERVLAEGTIRIRPAAQPSEAMVAPTAPYVWGTPPEITTIPVMRTQPASGMSHPGAGGDALPEDEVVNDGAAVEEDSTLSTSPAAGAAPEHDVGIGGAGRHFGTAVHACVELLARQGLTLDRADQHYQALRAAHEVSASTSGHPDPVQVAAAALSILRSPALGAEPAQVRHEVPVWAVLPNGGQPVLGGGIIDVLVTSGDHWAVLDVKTDAVPSGGPEILAGRYGPQLRMYADALEAAGSPPVTRLGLLLTSLLGADGTALHVSVPRGPAGVN